MEFWQNVLRIMDLEMVTPTPYGWFHLLFIGITIGFAVLLCALNKKITDTHVKNIILGVALTVFTLEIYKQINFSFSYENGIAFDYQWYSFPWQFCSMPMYVGLLAGVIRKGIVHDALCAFLGTYAVFAGLCVMVYPNDVFLSTIGINIQTMICHGSMVTIGVFLLYRGYVKLEQKTILRALPVFATAIIIAVILNEVAFYAGILETETFNMFFISRHCAPSLPVYSNVQQYVPYPWCLIIYFVGFSLAAYIILSVAIGIKNSIEKINRKKLR